MEKSIISQAPASTVSVQDEWIDVAALARVEISSEDTAHPIEAALAHDSKSEQGWKAGVPGAQTIRLVFDKPFSIRRIKLKFSETEQERNQEFSLKWLPSGETTYREIVRQQFNFSPPHTTAELEEYNVKLEDAAALELQIVPDRNGGEAWATLSLLRIE